MTITMDKDKPFILMAQKDEDIFIYTFENEHDLIVKYANNYFEKDLGLTWGCEFLPDKTDIFGYYPFLRFYEKRDLELYFGWRTDKWEKIRLAIAAASIGWKNIKPHSFKKEITK